MLEIISHFSSEDFVSFFSWMSLSSPYQSIDVQAERALFAPLSDVEFIRRICFSTEQKEESL